MCIKVFRLLEAAMKQCIYISNLGFILLCTIFVAMSCAAGAPSERQTTAADLSVPVTETLTIQSTECQVFA